MNTDKIEIIWQVICKALIYFQSNWLALAAFILSLISLAITLRQNIKKRQYANDKTEKGDVGSNTTLHCKRKDLNRCSPTRILGQTEIDIAEWEE